MAKKARYQPKKKARMMKDEGMHMMENGEMMSDADMEKMMRNRKKKARYQGK